ncbi:MAG: glycosyl transferase family 1 [Desulfuromonas sp.]|nr:MAG: glycosyl transferase family 1 [Desulfuromonas sp.]
MGKKILHILSQIPDATGSGIYLQAALRHAAECGFENTLLAGVPVHSNHHEKLTLGAANFCPVYFGEEIPFPVVGMSDVMPYPSTRFSDLSPAQLEIYCHTFERKLEDAVERWQPDLIHSHHLWLLTSLARRKFTEIPLITSCHGSDLRQFHTCPHLQERVLSGCRDVDIVCALSEIQKLEIAQLYGIPEERIRVVGAGYEKRRFYQPQEKKHSDRPQLLYAGKLSRAKGVPWLLQALTQLPAGSFDFHLVGDSSGPEKEEILALAAPLGDAIHIHGKLEQEKLADLMRASDIFILPSFFEGLPLVLLEALACGCRIITTALPGVSELFSGIESERVELIDLPQMIAIDAPHPAEEELFVADLKQTVETQCAHLAKTNADAPCPKIDALLKDYTWGGIFRKIERLYLELTDSAE